MTRLIPLAAVAIAALTLGACSSNQPPRAAAQPTIVTNVHPYYAGSGVVQAVMATPVMAGTGSSSEPLQRLEIKMDNGKIQYVDTPSRDFTRGTRVILTEDRLIRRV